MSDRIINVRHVRQRELPTRIANHSLYDEANGPHNPHRYVYQSEWTDPTGEIAVLLITKTAAEKCITVNGTDT